MWVAFFRTLVWYICKLCPKNLVKNGAKYRGLRKYSTKILILRKLRINEPYRFWWGRIPKKSDFLERNIENDKFRQTQEQRRAKAHCRQVKQTRREPRSHALRGNAYGTLCVPCTRISVAPTQRTQSVQDAFPRRAWERAILWDIIPLFF